MPRDHKIFYCYECKTIIPTLDKVLFIERNNARTFCSEQCIFSFFRPLMEFLDEEEKVLRERLKIKEETNLTQDELQNFIQQTLEDPDEIWIDCDELSEEIYHFITTFDINSSKLNMIVLVLMFGNRPSFTLFATVTYDERLVERYKHGIRLDNIKEMSPVENQVQQELVPDEIPIDQEIINLVERKKSILLAQLMENRVEEDIPFEEFINYDAYLQGTLENPDEIYREVEDTGEIFLTYIKNYQDAKDSFFYIAICLHYETDFDSEEETLIPIFSFPSIDSNLYKSFRTGEKINGPSIN